MSLYMEIQKLANDALAFEDHSTKAMKSKLNMEQLQGKVEQFKKWHEEHKVVLKGVNRIPPIHLQCHEIPSKCCRDEEQRLEGRVNIIVKE